MTKYRTEFEALVCGVNGSVVAIEPFETNSPRERVFLALGDAAVFLTREQARKVIAGIQKALKAPKPKCEECGR